MKPISGFLANDGKFFESEDECQRYELHSTLRLRARNISSVDWSYAKLPADIKELLSELYYEYSFIQGIFELSHPERVDYFKSDKVLDFICELRTPNSVMHHLLVVIRCLLAQEEDESPRSGLEPLRELIQALDRLVCYLLYGDSDLLRASCRPVVTEGQDVSLSSDYTP